MPDDRAPRTNSRKPKRRTRSCPTPGSARAYDQFGHAGVDPSGRFRRGGRARRGSRRASAGLPTRSAISSARFSARGRRARSRQRRLSRRRLCATTSSSRSRRRRAAPRRRSASRRWRIARPATAPAPSRARRPRPVRPAHGQGQVRVSQGFSRSSRRVRNATAPARSFRSRARPAAALDASEAEDAVGQDSRRRRSGRSHPAGRRRRGRIERRPAGRLYTSWSALKPHPVFQRESSDLHCEMPISFATCGARRRNRDSDARRPRQDQGAAGNAERTGVPPARQGHQARAQRAHGDLFCHVAIETPVNLTARQKDLLREFEAINAEDPGTHNPRAKNWFDRVREFFGP